LRITKVTEGRRLIVRQTDCYERTDALIVALHPRYLSIRLKGHRDSVDVPYDTILDLGRKMQSRWRKVG
jgi:hypothetical protein